MELSASNHSNLGKVKIFCLIVLIFLIHSVNNYIVINNDNLPLLYDQRGFYHNSLAIDTALENYKASIDVEELSETLRDMTIYPPLRHLISVLFYSLMGKSYKVALYTNLIYFFMLMFFFYKLVSLIFDKETGILACFIISFLPGVFGFSRLYMLDFAVLSLMPLALFFFYKTNFFTHKFYSFIFGFILAIGYLHKQTFIIFMLPFLIYCLFVSFIKHKNNELILGKIITGLFLALAGFLPALVWTVFSLHGQQFLVKASFSLGSNLNWQALHNIWWDNFYSFMLYPVIWVVFIFSAAGFLIFEKNKRIALLYIPAILFYQTFFLPEDLPRHNMPVLIIMAAVIAVSLKNGFYIAKKNSLRKVVISLYSVFMVLQFIYLCYIRTENIENKNIFHTIERRFQRSGLLYPLRINIPIAHLSKIIESASKDMFEPHIAILKENNLAETLYFCLNEGRIRYHFVPIYRLVDVSYNAGAQKAEIVSNMQRIDMLLLPISLEDISRDWHYNELKEIHRDLFYGGFAFYLKMSLNNRGNGVNPELFERDYVENVFGIFLDKLIVDFSRFELIAEVDLDPSIFPESSRVYLYRK
ncbi:MAG: glycosyltransferase family 39 protein [Candidatus Omnitrophica bacterium]|nr:glycosyltransferase family 39 protein [Candidatus Omnitrophota bacterium]